MPPCGRVDGEVPPGGCARIVAPPCEKSGGTPIRVVVNAMSGETLIEFDLPEPPADEAAEAFLVLGDAPDGGGGLEMRVESGAAGADPSAAPEQLVLARNAALVTDPLV